MICDASPYPPPSPMPPIDPVRMLASAHAQALRNLAKSTDAASNGHAALVWLRGEDQRIAQESAARLLTALEDACAAAARTGEADPSAIADLADRAHAQHEALCEPGAPLPAWLNGCAERWERWAR